MPVRKPSLEEWFLIYQLDRIKKDHVHLPVQIDIDVTRLSNHFEEKGQELPTTSLMIKAAGLLAEVCPEVNRAVYRTFYGVRILEPDYVSVNLPIMIRNDDHSFIAATVVKDANSANLNAIKSQIKEALGQKLSQLRIGKYVFKKKNNLINRLRLKIIHWMIKNFPGVHENFGGGGITVSSLMNLDRPGLDMTMVAYGPTAFTIGSCNVVKRGERDIMRVGLAYDHCAFNGEIGVKASTILSEILRAEEDQYFNRLVD